MRTTIDIPDDLLRRAKATAALQGVKLKKLIADYIENGLQESAPSRTIVGHKRPLPEFVKHLGRAIPSLTGAEIEKLLLKEDLEAIGRDRSS